MRLIFLFIYSCCVAPSGEFGEDDGYILFDSILEDSLFISFFPYNLNNLIIDLAFVLRIIWII